MRSSFAFALLIANNGTTFRTSNFNRLASNVTSQTCDGRAPNTTQLLFTPKANRQYLDPIRVRPHQAAMIDTAGTLAAGLLPCNTIVKISTRSAARESPFPPRHLPLQLQLTLPKPESLLRPTSIFMAPITLLQRHLRPHGHPSCVQPPRNLCSLSENP